MGNQPPGEALPRDGSVSGRVLGFFGFSWQEQARIARSASDPAREHRAGHQPDPSPQAPPLAYPARPDTAPKTIGSPVSRPPDNSPPGISSLTTQPRLSADGGSLGPLTVRAASICGLRHAHEGHTREDAFAIGHTAGGTVIAAVADGVGSDTARFSAVGAHLASLLAVGLITGLLKAGAPVEPPAACARLAAAMRNNAKRFIDEPFNEQALATTLLVAWVSPHGEYKGFTVGDGGMFRLADGRATMLTQDNDGLTTRTEALPAPYSRPIGLAGQLAPGEALLLATDGLSVPLASPDVAQVLGGQWSKPPSPLGFLADLSFDRRGEFDDRTGAAIWFSPGQDTR